MKKYQIIYADPPWSYKDKSCNGNCTQYYNTMSLNDLKNMNVYDLTDKDCILFIWSTYPMLQECFELIKAWGFKYKTIGFQWIKLNKKNNKPFFGLGRWTRGNTECCLIATKGNIHVINHGISQLIFSPIREHSRKPDVVRELIVKLVGDLPRIELFARNTTDGWDVFGDEVLKFNN